MMVNYLYDPDSLEKNHELFLKQKYNTLTKLELF